MKQIPETVVADWVKNKKRIQDRINRIKKRIRKYNKQLLHYEMRIKMIDKFEKEHKHDGD
jgi:predicted DNA-binding protein YlxM (UPF0122 family)